MPCWTCYPGGCRCPEVSECPACGEYTCECPNCEDCGELFVAGEGAAADRCAACLADAAEEALAEAPPLVRALAAGVRARGRRWVWCPRNQTAGAVLSRDDGAVA